MLTYNQRYRPRTTREYTKSDLTVYDSAGNTALNALTVYGKSEVVDGAIKSAGEGWSVVDLGTLKWTYDSTYNVFMTSDVNYAITDAMLCAEYEYLQKVQSWSQLQNKQFAAPYGIQIGFKNTDYTDPAQFKSAMSGVLLYYQLADPTQGNAIAVKTDNGTGIDGTMAVFETGTPLYGVSDTVRDAMQWDGSAGTVTKNCGKVRLADLPWNYNTASALNPFFWTYSEIFQSGNIKFIGPYSTTLYNLICTKYPTVKRNITEFISKTITVDGAPTKVTQLQIKDTDYTTVEDFVASLGDAELVYELATPIITSLTTAENASIAGLRTFDGTTHFTNNAVTDMTVNYTIRVPTIN